MKVALRVSTGVKIIVWRDEETYHSHRAESVAEPQVCLAVDLFEVIAELAGLDLDDGAQAAEAVALADRAQRLLGDEVKASDGGESSYGSGS